MIRILKISLEEEEYALAEDKARDMGMSVTDYLRFLITGNRRSDEVFTPEIAVSRALELFSGSAEPFALNDCYSKEEWAQLGKMSGIFGKRFYNYISDNPELGIEFAGIGKYRRSTYIVKSKETDNSSE